MSIFRSFWRAGYICSRLYHGFHSGHSAADNCFQLCNVNGIRIFITSCYTLYTTALVTGNIANRYIAFGRMPYIAIISCCRFLIVIITILAIICCSNY